MKVELIFKADQPTRNGRIYSRQVLERAIEDFNQRAPKFGGPVTGALIQRLESVSHETLSLEVKDDDSLWAEIRVLDTPQGKILKSLMNNSIVGFDMKGMGQMNDNVVSDLTIESIDYCDTRPPAKEQQ
jgi:hypothetical protein